MADQEEDIEGLEDQGLDHEAESPVVTTPARAGETFVPYNGSACRFTRTARPSLPTITMASGIASSSCSEASVEAGRAMSILAG